MDSPVRNRAHQPENFGANVRIAAEEFFEPRTESELLEILNLVRPKPVRVIGRLHSWSDVIQAESIALGLRHVNQVTIDGDQVHIGGGAQIKQVLTELKRDGKTLPSVGFIAEQSIAGAIATGTHGSGRHSLSHYVTGIRIARYDTQSGEAMIEEIVEGDDLLAMRCSLGSLGVVLRVTMQCRPDYNVEESFREYVDLQQVLSREHEYPLQQFYLIPWRWNYIAQHRRETNSDRSSLAAVYGWYRFLAFDVGMHFLILSAVRGIKSFRAVRILFQRVLPRFVVKGWRVTADSRSQLVMKHDLFRHIEIEFFVQLERLPEAMDFVQELIDSLGCANTEVSESLKRRIAETDMLSDWEAARGTYFHHYPICIRKIQADQTLISMASGIVPTTHSSSSDDSESKHLAPAVWYSVSLISYQSSAQRESFRQFARILAACVVQHFGARLHWGKYFPLPVSLARKSYPAMERFCDLRRDYDPDGRFLNRWTTEVFDTHSSSQGHPST